MKVATGKKVQIKDFFRPGEDYRRIVLAEIHKQIAADPDKYYSNALDILKSIPENQPFYIKDGTIVVLI